MNLNQGAEWALHTCLNLGWLAEGAPAQTAARLAAFYDLPPAYLNKQLQALTRASILTSVIGPRGGFRLARRLAEISLLDIVVGIEGRSEVFSRAWNAGQLGDKPAAGFTSAYERRGGHESTLLALYHTFCHWGSLIVPSGYVDHDVAHAAGGNPYGISRIGGDGPPNPAVLAAARLQGRHPAALADALAVSAGKAA